MAKRNTSQHRGALARPITIDALKPHFGTDQVIEAIDRELMRKMGIDWDDERKWERAFRALAFMHVPAYRFDEDFMSWLKFKPSKGGRKGINYVAIVIDVEAKIEELRKSGSPKHHCVKQACSALVGKVKEYRQLTFAQIQSAYYRNKRGVHELQQRFDDPSFLYAALHVRPKNEHRKLLELRHWSAPRRYRRPA